MPRGNTSALEAPVGQGRGGEGRRSSGGGSPAPPEPAGGNPRERVGTHQPKTALLSAPGGTGGDL